ncbi:GNAT family N-acetyltransferase [Micromonospora peucetia]|uniref:GNAT family N-acetyltransferase n=1 Tax=Micromonospora peucetia TaxID=47871 RepID=UPI00224F9C8E|nr:GNAT family N-acetyltransferase [Micromonospora peucetia]MCX4390290.1 GNAT family N-acetyltransferase [Micromonospora peucetia]
MDVSPDAVAGDPPTAAPPAVDLLRDVEPGDLDAYVRMRCDPAVMAELGGPQPRERVAAQLRRDLETVRDGSAWIKMIIPGGAAQVAGTVTLYSHAGISEIGWMVAPEFQGRGLAGRAVRAVLDLARADGRWGPIHAFPATTNAASNAICRSGGFAFVGEEQTAFGGRLFRTNHWVIDPSAQPDGSSAGRPRGDVVPA